jgi:hypothetical protein
MQATTQYFGKSFFSIGLSVSSPFKKFYAAYLGVKITGSCCVGNGGAPCEPHPRFGPGVLCVGLLLLLPGEKKGQEFYKERCVHLERYSISVYDIKQLNQVSEQI